MQSNVHRCSAMNKKEIAPFGATWMDLEFFCSIMNLFNNLFNNELNIMLKEISLTKKEKYCIISFTCEI